MKNLLFVVLLSLAVFNGFSYYKTGKIPVRDWGEQVARDGLVTTLKSFSFSKTVNKAKQHINEVTDAEASAPGPQKIQIYKWTDAQGVVHYDNKLVPGAAAITIDPNVNVLPMEDAPEIAPAEKPAVNQQQEMQENMEKIRRGMEARSGI